MCPRHRAKTKAINGASIVEKMFHLNIGVKTSAVRMLNIMGSIKNVHVNAAYVETEYPMYDCQINDCAKYTQRLPHDVNDANYG